MVTGSEATVMQYTKHVWNGMHIIDGFQMSIKNPTSGGQMCNEVVVVQQTFSFERSFFYFFETGGKGSV